MQFSINQSVLKVINQIENAGGEAYIVGGCVRDILLSHCPQDFDVATSLPPERIIEIFPKTIATGLKHGTVTVVMDQEMIEVTTYRTDGKYNDSRHPEKVFFVSNLSEDLSRRDFTVNAIAYNPKSGIVDKFNGIDDLNNGILRAVGNPSKRFSEDALRIMRLFRFACQLDFAIEENTLSTALNLSNNLNSISRERIATELFKALMSEHPERISPLIKTNALSFCGIGSDTVSKEISNLPLDRDIRFYKFIMDLKGEHITVCKELKTDKNLQRFCADVSEILLNPPKNISECKKTLQKYSKKATYSALVLSGGDAEMISYIEESNEPYRISDLAVTGEDLKEIGICGKAIGKALEKLALFIIDNPDCNTKEELIKHLLK